MFSFFKCIRLIMFIKSCRLIALVWSTRLLLFRQIRLIRFFRLIRMIRRSPDYLSWFRSIKETRISSHFRLIIFSKFIRLLMCLIGGNECTMARFLRLIWLVRLISLIMLVALIRLIWLIQLFWSVKQIELIKLFGVLRSNRLLLFTQIRWITFFALIRLIRRSLDYLSSQCLFHQSC